MTLGAAALMGALPACAPAAPQDDWSSGECSAPASTPIDQMIDRVFTCELLSLGVPRSVADTAANEADRVAWCESRFDPNAIAYGGRYVTTPHPVTGYRYTAAGLFQIIRRTADAYVPGGYAAAFDPVSNIRGAAILWEWGWSRDRDPWTPWVCKPGSDAERRAAAER